MRLPRFHLAFQSAAVVSVSRWLLVPMMALGVITACGSGSSGSSVKTPEQLLMKIPGCTNVQPNSGAQLLDRESATCDFGGTADDPVTLDAYTFDSQGQVSQWLKIATGLGSGVFVVGDRWVVQADTTDQAHTVQSAVGGSVH